MKTVVFWGAGATASLGIRTTRKQGAFIQRLARPGDRRTIGERVCHALGRAAVPPWNDAFADLLTILGDGGKITKATDVREDALAAMARNWADRSPDELRRRVLHLRTTYDWLALTAIIKACPGSVDGRFKINDVFNIIDLHGQSGHGFHADDTFLTPQQVGGAKSALKMLLQAMFFVDWQVAGQAGDGQLRLHYDFAVALGKRVQRQGVALAGEETVYESPCFYAGDVGFASMNYDPIGLWCQTVANRELNNSATVPHIGAPARKLQHFLDPAHFVAGMRIGKKKQQRVWHSMTEAVVQRLNEDGHRIRTTKFLLPHGCLCWRECANCGKLSNYWGHSWDVGSATLIPPPPLRAFEPIVDLHAALTDEEREALRRGEVDARACVHCYTLTYTHHTSTQMQSSLKERPPAFLEEIQRELRVVLSKAQHIVLMGYSLPPDDVVYRAFFAAHRSRSEGSVKCTVVDKREGYGWLGPERLAESADHHEDAVGAAREIFGADNVRFYGGGIPEVFMEDGVVADRAIERLLVWQAY